MTHCVWTVCANNTVYSELLLSVCNPGTWAYTKQRQAPREPPQTLEKRKEQILDSESLMSFRNHHVCMCHLNPWLVDRHLVLPQQGRNSGCLDLASRGLSQCAFPLLQQRLCVQFWVNEIIKYRKAAGKRINSDQQTADIIWPADMKRAPQWESKQNIMTSNPELTSILQKTAADPTPELMQSGVLQGEMSS